MLLLSPDESPRRACRRYAGGHRALDFALFMGCEGRTRLPVHGAARQRRKAASGRLQPHLHHGPGHCAHAGRGAVLVYRVSGIPGIPRRP
ncbi:hypothetical protein G6F35_018758 [Rhizopus arrhizus]|nr:hypothetical protein G6F35_018758 [Rhizopus arrhizus]